MIEEDEGDELGSSDVSDADGDIIVDPPGESADASDLADVQHAEIATEIFNDIQEALGIEGANGDGTYSGYGQLGIVPQLQKPVWGWAMTSESGQAEMAAAMAGLPADALQDKATLTGDMLPIGSAAGMTYEAGKPFLIDKDGTSSNMKAKSAEPVFSVGIPKRAAVKNGNYLRAAANASNQDDFDSYIEKLDKFFSNASEGTIAAAVLKQIKESMSHGISSEGSSKGDYGTVVEGLVPASGVGETSTERLSAEQRSTIVDFLGKCGKIFETSGPIWTAYSKAILWGEVKNSYQAWSDADNLKGKLQEDAAINTGDSGAVTAEKLATLLNLENWKSSSTLYAGILGYFDPAELGSSATHSSFYNGIFRSVSSADGDEAVDKATNAREHMATAVTNSIKESSTYDDYLLLFKLYVKVLAALKVLGTEGPVTVDTIGDMLAAEAAADAETLNGLLDNAVEDAGGTVTVDQNVPPAGKSQVTQAQKDAAANIRTSIKDYLSINTPRFAAAKERRREIAYNASETRKAAVETTFQGVYPIEGKSSCGVSQLLYNQNQQELLDLTPAEISSLVPMIRIFKQGADYQQELPFESNAFNDTDRNTIESNKNMIVENYNKGNSVGIRSLDWSYQGTNPANDTKDISLTLTLYFQSFTDILRERQTGQKGEDNSGQFSYKDLITRSGPQQGSSGDSATDQSDWDPEYFRIKFLIGYAYSDPANGAGDIIPSSKRMAIDQCVLPIIATLIDHRFDIQEDGSVNLIITYRGYLEAVAFSSGANIFANAELEGVFSKASNLFQTIISECGRTDASNRLRANLTTQLDWFGKELQTLVFSSILREMRANGKIYTITPRVNDLISRKIISVDTDLYPPTSADQPNLISDLVDAAKATQKCSEKDLEKCVEDIFTQNIDPQLVLADGRRSVPFFFVGDLIKTVKILVNASYGARAEEKSLGNAAKKAFENTRIILTDIGLTQDPLTDGFEHHINLADIPVSVETFSVWFVNKITKFQGNKQFPEYSFGLFMEEFLSVVLQKFKSYADETGKNDTLTNATSIQRTQVFSPVDTVGICANKVVKKNSPGRNSKLTYDLFVPDDEGKSGKCKSITRITQGDTDGGTMQFYAEQATENWINYFIYYPRISGLKCEATSFPVPTQDNLKKGYYQFNFGVNSGMVQRISFEKDDQPYVREARFFASETNYKRNRILQLREPYKLTIETFGLPNIFPGSVCFIDSRTIDMALGSISDKDSLAYMLGFGGYHLITHSKNKIAPGVFNTTLTAKWTSHGEAATLNEALQRSVPGKETAKGCGFSINASNNAASRKKVEKAFTELGYPGGGMLNAATNDDIKNFPSEEIAKHFKKFLEAESERLD